MTAVIMKTITLTVVRARRIVVPIGVFLKSWARRTKDRFVSLNFESRDNYFNCAQVSTTHC
jgi:uncharacterized protein (DUF885 family)